MREILFRAKSIETSEWIQGFYSPLVLPLIGHNAHYINERGFRAVEIDINTLGQYTGKNDCEGNKIFEGDILLKPGIPEITKPKYLNLRFVVAWNDLYAAFRYTEILTTSGEGAFIPHSSSYFNIIGNIHDNPELL